MGAWEVRTVLDAAAARRWAQDCLTALEQDRDAIDRINVFPVADGDTGTNLVHTMRAAVDAMDTAAPGTLGGVLAATAKGALAGARGNSGMLLSQVLRGIAEELQNVAVADGNTLRRALSRSNTLATQAVGEPVDGTLLSVLRSAAEAVDACESDRIDLVVRSAVNASVGALELTTGQLPALAKAGVVDAGGRGVVILLDVLHAVLHGTRLAEAAPPPGVTAGQHHESQYAYEVMYLLSDVDAASASRLRDRLTETGDCVSVVSDGSGSWAVHVHCDDIGTAIEYGIETGRVHGITVVRFADQTVAGNGILACVRGEELTELFRAEGTEVLEVGGAPVRSVDLVAAMRASKAAHVVVLPNDLGTAEIAEDAARSMVRGGQEVVVVPTASPVQGLAALAVHDPARRRAEDAVAMAEAAAATRRGELVIAEQEALTWVGRCQPGDVLGLVDDEVVLIGGGVVAAASELADRMLTPGGELVTALVGADAPAGLPDELRNHLHRTHPEVELTCYPGGEALLMLGVE